MSKIIIFCTVLQEKRELMEREYYASDEK